MCVQNPKYLRNTSTPNRYAIVVFFVRNRFRILSTTSILNSKRTLPILTWPDVRYLTRIVLKLCCNGVLEDSNTNSSSSTEMKRLRKQDSGTMSNTHDEDLRPVILEIRTDVQRIYRRICSYFDSKSNFQESVQNVAKQLSKEGERKKYEKRAATLLRGVLRFADMIASSDAEIRRGLFEHLLDRTFDPLYGVERDVDFDDHVAMVASVKKSLRALRDSLNLKDISNIDADVAKVMWFDLIDSIESSFQYLITEVLQRHEVKPSAYSKVSEKLRAKFFSLKNTPPVIAESESPSSNETTTAETTTTTIEEESNAESSKQQE